MNIDFTKLAINKIGEYDSLDFYPKNHIVANGEIEILDGIPNSSSNIISVVIMKISKTSFTTTGNISFYGIYSDGECRSVYKNDQEYDDDYYEELTPITVLVSLALDSSILQYSDSAFVDFSNIENISDIKNTNSNFNDLLIYRIEEMIEKIK